MPTDMKRFMLCITPEIEAGAEELKKTEFYDKPYSEVYRHLLSLGLQTANICNDQQARNAKCYGIMGAVAPSVTTLSTPKLE